MNFEKIEDSDVTNSTDDVTNSTDDNSTTETTTGLENKE